MEPPLTSRTDMSIGSAVDSI